MKLSTMERDVAIKDALEVAIQRMESDADTKYGNRFRQSRYFTATQGKSVGYCNALIDEALALCGHPHYKLSHRRWSMAALEFLARFV